MRLPSVLLGATVLLGWAGNVSSVAIPSPSWESWLPIPVFSDPLGAERREASRAAAAAIRPALTPPPPGFIEGDDIPDEFLVFFEAHSPTYKHARCDSWSKLTFDAENVMKPAFERFYKNLNRMNIPYESLRNMTCEGSKNYIFTHFRILDTEVTSLQQLRRLGKMPGVSGIGNAYYEDEYPKPSWLESFVDFLSEVLPRNVMLATYYFSPRFKDPRRFSYNWNGFPENQSD
ncbi:hypothetical protein BJ508DRAFT_323366 [Ascobolus immersus RN42]|uniref:Uncharacterized protein n=1 Tax=Ascobolus immersus RN42 TaxID=1160509 RepID=A0A3N4IJC5_ASCIM|nr:hypothetical protein BJ508DRAFT_323366 [Ascobolus immersus RN42]